MRSRELPAFRTLTRAWPRAERSEHDDRLVLTAAGTTRWITDDPPADLSAWLARARDAELWWEERYRHDLVFPEAPDTHVLTELRCYMHDEELDPGRPAGVRDVVEDELDAAVALLEAAGVPLARWQLEQHLALRENELAAVLATGPVGAPTGVVAVAWDGREARLQALGVAEGARRQGLGRALVLGALNDWQGVSFGTAYAVAAPGSAAEALFRAVEMRPVTTVVRVARR